MQILLFFLILFSPAVLTSEQTYSGAMALGPFRIDRNVSMMRLFQGRASRGWLRSGRNK
jgi:hypothetical protein